MQRLKAGAAAVAAMLCATGCETYFDYDKVTVIEAQEDGWFENGDELVLATIDFRVQPGVAGSAEAFYSSGSFELAAGGLRDGDVASISNSAGLFTFDDLKVSSPSTVLAGQPIDIVGQVVVGIERDLTPGWIIREALRDSAADLEALLADVLESRPIGDLLADPTALMDDLANASAILNTDRAWYENLLLKIVSLGNDDDILNFNVLVFVPVTAGLAPIVDNAFAGLPDGFYGGAFPTEAVGGSVPAKRLDLRFYDHETDYIVETYIGGGTAGGPGGFVPDL